MNASFTTDRVETRARLDEETAVLDHKIENYTYEIWDMIIIDMNADDEKKLEELYVLRDAAREERRLLRVQWRNTFIYQ